MGRIEPPIELIDAAKPRKTVDEPARADERYRGLTAAPCCPDAPCDARRLGPSAERWQEKRDDTRIADMPTDPE
jgi:hypothetical protein